MSEVSALMKESPGSALAPSTAVGGVGGPESEFSPDTESSGTLILDFSASKSTC